MNCGKGKEQAETYGRKGIFWVINRKGSCWKGYSERKEIYQETVREKSTERSEMVRERKIYPCLWFGGQEIVLDRSFLPSS